VIADVILVFVAYIPFVASGGMGTMDPTTPSAPPMGGFTVTMALLVALAVAQVYFLSREGQTLGKKALRIRIVRYDDGGNPGFVKAVVLRIFVNGFLGIIPLYGLADVLFIFGAEKRCIHDYIAGTKVVTA
jgi:uncharacterized RDD family membrane protein YckC